MNYPDSVIGDNLGLSFPVTIEPLLVQGVDFLTAAFHATGAISTDNQVLEIVRHKEFYGGGMGRKLLLSVRYKQAEPDLSTELFVKFPRDFGDPLRDLFAPVAEPEVRFGLLSRQSGFPVAVPTCYFADYHSETLSSIIISEKISYGENGIEPCHDKCQDYRLIEPLAHYQAMVKSMAALAGSHKAGYFGREINDQFPFDPSDIKQTDLIPYDQNELQIKLDKLCVFAEKYPNLFPSHLADPTFLQKFSKEAPKILEHELDMKKYLNSQADCVALCHWNVNVDNAWFWHDENGELQAGLLDWGSVSQMNLAQAFFGMMCAAETDFLDKHKNDLIGFFLSEFKRHGGADIDVGQFKLCLKMSVALLGLAWMIDAPTLIEAEIENLANVKDRFDPKLQDNFLARAQLHLLTVFLNEWYVEDLGTVVDAYC